MLGESERVEEFRKGCESRFPHSTMFKRPEEILELKRRVFGQKEEGSNLMGGDTF